MKTSLWRWLKRLPRLLTVRRGEPAEYDRRILGLQRDIILPAKLVVIGVVFYNLYFSDWVGGLPTSYGVVLETIRDFFGTYVLFNLLVGVCSSSSTGFRAALSSGWFSWPADGRRVSRRVDGVNGRL